MDEPYVTSYRASSYCGGGSCIEVAALPDGKTAVRNPNGTTDPLVLGGAAWDAFLLGIKGGQFGSGHR